MLKKTVPIPSIYFIGEYGHYHFVIAQHILGITLRDLLLGNEPYDLQTLVFDMGVMVAQIQNHRFLKSGIFNPDLKVTKSALQSDLLAFATECMQHEMPSVCFSLICSIAPVIVYPHSSIISQRKKSLYWFMEILTQLIF